MIRAGGIPSRALALGLLAIVLLGVSVGAASIGKTVVHARQDLAVARSLRDRLVQIVAREPLNKEQLATVEGELDRSKIFLSARTHALAAAEMREILEQAVALTGGEVDSVRVMPRRQQDSDASDVGVPISLGVVMQGRFPELFELLHWLETTSPLLFVTSFEIQAGGGRYRASAEGAEGADVVLQMRFQVDGYFRPETQS